MACKLGCGLFLSPQLSLKCLFCTHFLHTRLQRVQNKLFLAFLEFSMNIVLMHACECVDYIGFDISDRKKKYFYLVKRFQQRRSSFTICVTAFDEVECNPNFGCPHRRPKLTIRGAIMCFLFYFYANVQRNVTWGIYCYLTIELDHAKRDSRLAAYGGVMLQRFEV